MSDMAMKIYWRGFRYGLLGLLAAMVIYGAGPRLRAQEPAPTPLPIQIDPNDPMASRQERIRRAQQLIDERRQEARRQKAIQEAQAKKEARQQAAPPAAPAAGEAAGAQQNATVARPGKPPVKPNAAPPPVESGLAINRQARVPHATFYMLPASVNVLMGETFDIDTRLLNPDHLPIDRVQVLLNYPPDVLEPLSIHQDAIAPLLADEPKFLVDHQNGFIIYRAVLNRPIDASEIALIKIVWKARTLTDGVEIRPSVNGEISAAFQGDKVATEGMLGADESLGGVIVRVHGDDPVIPQGRRIIFDPLRDISLVKAGFPEQANLRVPQVWIDQPAEGLLEPGQWLTVDLGVDNPDRVIFDEIRLAARFDPEAIEIVDADLGNWIATGVNLLDGPFRESWPWDILYANHADNERGYFQYRMAMKALREQPTGAIARVFARVRKPVQAPVFEWIHGNEAMPDHPTTGVYLFGENLSRRNQEGSGGILFPAQAAADGVSREKADPSMYRF